MQNKYIENGYFRAKVATLGSIQSITHDRGNILSEVIVL